MPPEFPPAEYLDCGSVAPIGDEIVLPIVDATGMPVPLWAAKGDPPPADADPHAVAVLLAEIAQTQEPAE